MNFPKQVSTLITNKYVLYFVVFMAASNLLGYLIANNIGAVILFILVGMITVNFSKNMVIILLACIFITNLLVAHKTIKENMENMDANKAAKQEEEEEDKINDINPTIKKGINAIKQSTNSEEAKTLYNSSKMNKNEPIIMPLHDSNNTDLNEHHETSEVNETTGM